jgi:hypothetical protein
LNGQNQEKAFNTEFTKTTENVEPKPRTAVMAKQFAETSKCAIPIFRSTGFSLCGFDFRGIHRKSHTG